MSVESSFVPPANTKGVTPGQKLSQVQTDQFWKDKAQEARAQMEFVQAQKTIESLNSPAAAPEPPVKMTGSINLGNIDFQEQARRAQEATERARNEAEARAQALAEENTKLKEMMVTQQITAMQTTLTGQIQKLQADLAANRGSSKSIGDQLKEIMDSAALLGLVRPESAKQSVPAVQQATDAAISLEMLRLQLEDKRTERQFAWQMEKDRRQFQIELKKLDQANRMALADSQGKRAQMDMLLKTPEIIGTAIAKGLMAKAEGAAGVSARPPTATRPQRVAQEAVNQMAGEHQTSISPDNAGGPEAGVPRKIQAGVGEAGEIECPECGGVIAIGPSSTKGICAACEFSAEVVRIGAANEATL